MDVREKLVKQAISHFWYGVSHDIFSEPVTTYAKLAIEALEKEKESGVTVQEWISVEDRLPDKPMRCLVYTKRGGYCGYDITYYNQGFYSEYSKVTHWMPLPKPPKENDYGKM